MDLLRIRNALLLGTVSSDRKAIEGEPGRSLAGTAFPVLFETGPCACAPHGRGPCPGFICTPVEHCRSGVCRAYRERRFAPRAAVPEAPFRIRVGGGVGAGPSTRGTAGRRPDGRGLPSHLPARALTLRFGRPPPAGGGRRRRGNGRPVKRSGPGSPPQSAQTWPVVRMKREVFLSGHTIHRYHGFGYGGDRPSGNRPPGPRAPPRGDRTPARRAPPGGDRRPGGPGVGGARPRGGRAAQCGIRPVAGPGSVPRAMPIRRFTARWSSRF